MTTYRRKALPAMAVALLVALGTSSCAPHAGGTKQATSATPVYLDLHRSFEDRAADLVSRMTLEEKVAQMQNNAPAIPRLGVAAYEWWNEGLHGVARAGGATVFPQAIGLAATFDTALMGQVATAVSDEARAKHQEFLRHDMHGRYEGLTFWSPNINIFRDPRWGRGQETYGEDPFLTSRMGVAFVHGMQGDDPTYRKLDATAKHFAVHSGPESERHHFDVHPSERDLHDTYLPAFQALVQEGHVDAVMGAYNRVNGESASASPRLLGEILRKDWGFKGYVVSDCDSVDDIFARHKMVATAEEASALAVKNGDDLNCGHTYAALVNAVHQGLVSEADIDISLKRLMLARMRLGMFDPPERVRWALIPYSVNQSAEHDALARRAAEASIVLLKNDGILPLSRELRHVAVIGPTADDVTALLGNYHGTPADPVTILQGIREALPQAEVTYAHGASLVQGFDGQGTAALIESRYLRPAADAVEHGLQAEYFRGNDFASTPVLTRVDPKIGFQWDHGTPTDDLIMRGELPSDHALAIHEFSVRWRGQLLPPVSGRYELSAPASDGYRLYVDGRLVLDAWSGDATAERPRSAFVDLKADKPYDVRLEYANNNQNHEVRLAWRLPGAKPPLEEALEAARRADVVIYVGGLNSNVEGEEMKVNYPGFAGGDRTDLRLPATQEKLLEALHRTGKPVVMVLTSGSALAIDWAKQHVPGIVLAWYPGQRGGNAVADVLFGAANPAGRLPVTFYKASEKLPAFDNYDMRGRTYRYFEGTPLYPFGYGLSYTSFGYSDLAIDRDSIARDGSMHVTLKVKNTGRRAGDEVVQLYLRPLQAKDTQAQKDLRGFQRIALQPGEEREVRFTVSATKDLRYYDEQQHADAVAPGRYEVQVGASSTDIRATRTFTVTP
ncbi:glycoside hydrolase family 3 protein [Dyella jiangningensis]|uniref:Beta-D-glucoside glucohydrolase n=1 Tax=Dyella jiangningensis TaxID=1379159 RepID=A0A328NZX2_9GAMM|nr:glycoside hydrolase family 3 protein [Dyella jiangningensis]RAO74703.1 glucan 1,4-alpha-glucosidase [Dyella jiangningensis]